MDNRKGQLIAVIDNDPILLRSLTRLLDASGFATMSFSSAEAFLASSTANRATCLVLDIDLDGMSGIDLRRRLASSGNTLPVVFITAINDEATEQEARSSGCVAYLRKPFGGKELIGAVNDAVH